MAATIATYSSDERKKIFSNFVDAIRLALELKDQVERIQDPQERHEAACRIISRQ